MLTSLEKPTFFFNLTFSEESDNSLFRCEAAFGGCQVMCFHPWSDITLPRMSLPDIRIVIDKWAEINQENGKKFAWVQVCSSKIASRGHDLSSAVFPNSCNTFTTQVRYVLISHRLAFYFVPLPY